MSKDTYTFGDNDNNNSSNDMFDMSDMTGMSMSFDKPKDLKKTFKSLISHSKKYVPIIIVAILSAIVSMVLMLIGPEKLSEITNLIGQGLMRPMNLELIASIGITLIFFYVISGLFSFLQAFIMGTVTQKISKNLRTDISTKINRLPMSFFNKNTTGDILSRITNDVDTLGQNLNQGMINLVTCASLFVGSLVMMIKTNWLLSLTAVGAALIGFIAMGLIMKKSQKHFSGQQKYLGKINGHVEETYAGHTIVKAYNGEAEMRESFEALNKKLRKNTFMAQFLSGLMMPIMIFIENIGYVAVCVVGAILVVNGSISFGVIVAFIMYIRFFTQPMAQIAQAAQMLQAAAAAGERVFNFLEAEEMADESAKITNLETAKGKVEFRNVKFGYEDTDKVIIHNFSATASPGQKIAIVGPTGAGKTTLVNLLMRFNEIDSGEILIDDTPISQLTRENIHALFCMVLQDTWLFEGTIKDNIIYSKEGVSDEDVVAACKAVGLHHFIKTLPKGYDTLLDDKTNLSAGQKQQVTIARAMIENAPMLILDEATSSVDTRTELQIQRAMDKLMEGRTSFVIAHRLSTIKNADIILVLKDGDIIESGNHSELLEKGGFYAELYNSQFESAS